MLVTNYLKRIKIEGKAEEYVNDAIAFAKTNPNIKQLGIALCDTDLSDNKRDYIVRENFAIICVVPEGLSYEELDEIEDTVRFGIAHTEKELPEDYVPVWDKQ